MKGCLNLNALIGKNIVNNEMRRLKITSAGSGIVIFI